MFYIWFLSSTVLPQREVVSSTRLAVIPPAFSTRTLPAQATEYAFAFIQIPQDVSAELRYVSQLRGSKLTLRYQLLNSHFAASFSRVYFFFLFSGEAWKVFGCHLWREVIKSESDRRGWVFLQQSFSFIMHVPTELTRHWQTRRHWFTWLEKHENTQQKQRPDNVYFISSSTWTQWVLHWASNHPGALCVCAYKCHLRAEQTLMIFMLQS